MVTNNRAGTLLLSVIAMALGGCAERGAPSFVLFGAYFPAWMLVAGIGILVAVAARMLSLATGIAEALPFPLALCTSLGVITAVLMWLMWFAL
jgi:YtcA family